ncbi:MAG: hypothetical protein ACP5HH_06615 [Fervidicoccaceae archaeon]|nr:MAG: hypothetical protein C0179_05315 [Fervidicoccus sp.]
MLQIPIIFQTATLGNISSIDLLTSNPKLLISIGIQLILGILLGYILAKAFKYIIAFILVLIAGIVLNVWSLSGSGDYFQKITGSKEYLQYFIELAKLMSALLVGPVMAGFVIGLIIGWLHK